MFAKSTQPPPILAGVVLFMHGNDPPDDRVSVFTGAIGVFALCRPSDIRPGERTVRPDRRDDTGYRRPAKCGRIATFCRNLRHPWLQRGTTNPPGKYSDDAIRQRARCPNVVYSIQDRGACRKNRGSRGIKKRLAATALRISAQV